MKTAISLPNELFEELEALVKESGGTRSEIYVAALREYVARHVPDRVTDAFNRLADELENGTEEEETRSFRREATRRAFERTEW
ncbi:MAG: ribbon-helix-helix protein, CopG family [Dehalococcoidia bacterium]|nr:ribbon-helix-helix protein, CopG family [Dehalococcoidia bacterium]